MSDRTKGRKPKKRRAPAPPPGLTGSQAQKEDEIADIGDRYQEERAGEKISTGIDEHARKVETTKDVKSRENESITCETSKMVITSIDEEMGSKYPKGLSPFSDESDSESVSRPGKSPAQNSPVSQGFAHPNDAENDGKTETSSSYMKNQTGLGYPKGLSPFSDDSDSEAVSKFDESPAPKGVPSLADTKDDEKLETTTLSNVKQIGLVYPKGLRPFSDESDSEDVGRSDVSPAPKIPRPDDDEDGGKRETMASRIANPTGTYPKGLSPFSDESDPEHTNKSYESPAPTFPHIPRLEDANDNGKRQAASSSNAKKITVEYPKGLSPFSDESDTEADSQPTKSPPLNSTVSQAIPRHDGTSNDQERRITTSNQVGFNHPKGLGPFSDESGSEVVNLYVVRNPSPLKSPRPNDFPRPPPRRKKKSSRGLGSIGSERQKEDRYEEHLKPVDRDSDSEQRTDETIHPDRTLDYPEELNPFSECASDDVGSLYSIDLDGESLTDEAFVVTNQDAPQKKTKVGRLKRALKSLRQAIGRLTACIRPKTEM